MSQALENMEVNRLAVSKFLHSRFLVVRGAHWQQLLSQSPEIKSEWDKLCVDAERVFQEILSFVEPAVALNLQVGFREILSDDVNAPFVAQATPEVLQSAKGKLKGIIAADLELDPYGSSDMNRESGEKVLPWNFEQETSRLAQITLDRLSGRKLRQLGNALGELKLLSPHFWRPPTEKAKVNLPGDVPESIRESHAAVIDGISRFVAELQKKFTPRAIILLVAEIEAITGKKAPKLPGELAKDATLDETDKYIKASRRSIFSELRQHDKKAFSEWIAAAKKNSLPLERGVLRGVSALELNLRGDAILADLRSQRTRLNWIGGYSLQPTDDTEAGKRVAGSLMHSENPSAALLEACTQYAGAVRQAQENEREAYKKGKPYGQVEVSDEIRTKAAAKLKEAGIDF